MTPQYNLLYNAFCDGYVIYNSSLNVERFTTSGIAELSDLPESFLKEATKSGCLVDDGMDELEELKKIVRDTDQNNQQYQLIVNPTMNCNFHCWYCYEQHIHNSPMREDTIKRVQKLIDNIVTEQQELKHFHLSFFGGEPLMYFDRTVKPIVEYFDRVCKKKDIISGISFTSNGYLIRSDMVIFLKKHGVNFFQITLDGNREEHNKVRFISESQGSYDTILGNIKLLLKAEIHVTLRINYTSLNITGVKQISENLTDISTEMKAFLNVDFQRVWQDEKTPEEIDDVVDQTMEFFKGNGFRTTKRHNRFVRNSCYADKKNQALINYNGDIFKCTARDFNPAQRDGFLNQEGNIVWENTRLDRRVNVKFRNTPCLHCRITPLCNGGCSQQALEHKQDYCMANFSEAKKDEIIIDRFFARFIG